jgi:hypothetical protein
MTVVVVMGLWLAATAPDAAAVAAPKKAEAPPAKAEIVKPAAAKPASTSAEAARPAAATPGKLAPGVSKEMSDAIIAVNKSLGLESWPAHGVKPCIDRGGQGILAKDVTPEDAKRCASAAVEKGLPELGKSYVLAVLMGGIGPVTVIAVGAGDAAGWGAYSCDPTRACKPMKINPGNKWGKRLGERHAKACNESGTIWVPAGQRVCP